MTKVTGSDCFVSSLPRALEADEVKFLYFLRGNGGAYFLRRFEFPDHARHIAVKLRGLGLVSLSAGGVCNGEVTLTTLGNGYLDARMRCE